MPWSAHIENSDRNLYHIITDTKNEGVSLMARFCFYYEQRLHT